MLKAITREEENQLPLFKNHADAISFFKDKYGQAFKLETIEQIDGMACYFYALILNQETYLNGRALMKTGQPMQYNALKFLNSYQSIQIMDDGRVHIVH